MQSSLSVSKDIQYLTFHCGELLIGLELTDVQEINRQGDLRDVPETPPRIKGVLNLRGDVITMIDLQIIMRQTNETSRRPYNVFVRRDDEIVGLVTDGVSDILSLSDSAIDPPPTNINGLDGTLFKGVHSTTDNRLVLILDLAQLFSQLD